MKLKPTIERCNSSYKTTALSSNYQSLEIIRMIFWKVLYFGEAPNT